MTAKKALEGVLVHGTHHIPPTLQSQFKTARGLKFDDNTAQTWAVLFDENGKSLAGLQVFEAPNGDMVIFSGV